MSAANSANAVLLALKGTISIHFMDDTVLQGEYVSQDIYNIFVKVDGKPLLVPRSQIRYIEGGHIEQLEEDTSQTAFVKDEFVQIEPPAPSSEEPPSPHAFEQAPIPAPAPEPPPYQAEDDDTEDGTVILPPEISNLFDSAAEKVEEEDDKTFVLPPAADMSDFEEDEDDDLTFILSSSDEFSDDEDDGTVVLGPAAIIDELNDTEKTGLMLDEEEDSTFVFTSTPSKPAASLVCTAGPHSGQIFKLDSDVITIGRSSDNNVVLSGDKEISRHHSIISQEAGKFTIKDQNSLNGTFVNNEQVTTPRTLQPDDMILVGISTLKFQED